MQKLQFFLKMKIMTNTSKKRCDICNTKIDQTPDKGLKCEYCGKFLCPDCVDWRISSVE